MPKHWGRYWQLVPTCEVLGKHAETLGEILAISTDGKYWESMQKHWGRYWQLVQMGEVLGKHAETLWEVLAISTDG